MGKGDALPHFKDELHEQPITEKRLKPSKGCCTLDSD